MYVTYFKNASLDNLHFSPLPYNSFLGFLPVINGTNITHDTICEWGALTNRVYGKIKLKGENNRGQR